MKTRNVSRHASLVFFGMLGLSTQVVLAAPGENTGKVQLTKEYADGALNVGKHGFFLNISTVARTNHENTTSDPKAQPVSALAFAQEKLKADVRFFGLNKVLLHGRVDALAERYAPGLVRENTVAEGSLRVMGLEVLPTPVGSTPGNATYDKAREITDTFFEESGDVSVFGFDVSVKLQAKGTLRMDAYAASRNSDPKNGSAVSKMKATANLTADGRVGAGVDYVAKAEVHGSVKLVELNFTPTMTATRKFDGSEPIAERAIYTVRSVAPLNVTGLDGKVSVAVYGNPTAVIPPFALPILIKLDETTVWNPGPLVSYNKDLDNRSKTERFRATFL